MKAKISGMNCHYRYYDLETFFQTMEELNISYAEIWTGPQHFFVDYQMNDPVDKLLNLSNKYKVKIHCICPEQTNPKPHNMAAKDRALKDRTYDYFKRIIDLAQACGADKIVTTSGWGYLDEPREEAYKRSLAMQKRICQYARTKNIKVCMEALQKIESNLVNNSAQLKSYIEEVDEENLYGCIDFGAMAGAGEDITDYYRNLPKRIGHIHFVDGRPTGHLAWGDGDRDMKRDLELLETYGYEGYLSLENANSRYYMDPRAADKKTMKTYEEIK